MTETPKPLLEAKGISKDYWLEGKGRIHVLDGVDFTLHEGEVVGLVGKSGAGKSTLLHVLGTLDDPTEGTVLYKGEDLFARSEIHLADFRNSTLGFVFQSHYLLPEFSALENVMMPQMIRGLKRSESVKRAKEILSYLGLGERITHRPAELSGGEQQRVAIARAVANAPRVLLADEPTGNLDPHTADHVFQALMQLVKATRVAMLIATHNMELAGRMDRRVSLANGQVIELE
jgi:lipoprotein-releasing system ATP-binding protein